MLISLASYYSEAWTAAELFAAGQDGLGYETTIDNLYTDSAGTTQVTADGQVIGNVTDLYGVTTADATQATAAHKPTYDADNGKLINFDGVDDFLDTGVERVGGTGLFAASGEEFFVAVAFKVGFNEEGTLIGRATGTPSERTFQIFFQGTFDRGSTPGFWLRGVGGSTNSFGWNLDDGLLHVVWVNWDGVTATAGYDDSAPETLPVGTAAENAGQRIILGARTNGTAFHLESATGSAIVRDQAATAQEIEDTVNYLLALHQ